MDQINTNALPEDNVVNLKNEEENHRLNRFLEILLEADLKIMEQLLKNNND